MKKILFIFTLLFILTGCVKSKSLNDVIYIDSMGFDYVDNKYVVYFHISNPSTLITQEQGAGNVQIKYSVAKSVGDTIFQAVSNIHKNTNLNINLGLLKSVVFSKNFFYLENINKFYDFVKTTPEIYPTFNIFFTSENINDVYSITNPKATSPFFSLIGESITKSLIPPKNYSRFISEFKENTLSLNIPILKMEKSIWSDETNNITSISIDGICVLNKSKNEQILLDIKTFPGLIYLNDHTITNQTIEVKGFDNLIIDFDYCNFNIKSFNNNIYVEFNAIISAYHQNLNDLDITKILENEIKNEIQKIYWFCLSKEIDIFNIKDYMYRYKINHFNDIIFAINVDI